MNNETASIFNNGEAYDETFAATGLTTFIIATVLSCIGSGLVLLTGLLFYERMVKNKLFMKLIMGVSACDFIACFMGAFGHPKDGTLCVAQGFLTLYFTRASFMWCSCIALSLFSQVRYGCMKFSLFQMNCVVWPLNTVITAIPLFFGIAYGGCYDGTSIGTIYVIGMDSMPQNEVIKLYYEWIMTMYFIPLLLNLMLMMVISVYLHFIEKPRLLEMDDGPAAAVLNKIIGNVLIYPLLMILAWFPNAVFFFMTHRLANLILDGVNVDDNLYTFFRLQPYLLFSLSWAYCFGFFLACGFAWKSKEAKQQWQNLIFGKDDEKNNLVNMMHENGKGGQDEHGPESMYEDFEDDYLLEEELQNYRESVSERNEQNEHRESMGSRYGLSFSAPPASKSRQSSVTGTSTPTFIGTGVEVSTPSTSTFIGTGVEVSTTSTPTFIGIGTGTGTSESLNLNTPAATGAATSTGATAISTDKITINNNNSNITSGLSHSIDNHSNRSSVGTVGTASGGSGSVGTGSVGTGSPTSPRRSVHSNSDIEIEEDDFL